jgi:Zn-dependent protease with chaperone function
MFGNFFPLIVVLLIFSTYQVPEVPNFSLLEALIFLVFLTFSFAALVWMQFRHLARRTLETPLVRLDHRFNAMINRHIILAIVLFGIVIYGFNLPVFTIRIALLAAAPTLEALLYLGLFIIYLAAIYGCAHCVYRQIYRDDISLKAYVYSNINIAIPILIPWVLLSGLADLLQNLPFEWPRQVLSSPEGQAGYFLIFLVAVAISGPYLIQKLWRCTPLGYGLHRFRIEAICARAGVQYAEILNWPIFGGRMITAGVMGLVKRFRYILVTKALLEMLSPEELDAVIAHEIGHVKRFHLLFYILFMVGLMLLLYASRDFVSYFIIYFEAVYHLVASIGKNQTIVISAANSILIILTILVYFRYIFGFFMRNFERQADLYAFEVFGTAGPLISTFKKIAIASGQSPGKPNWHHFSIRQRIEYLRRCEADRVWVKRHDRKLRQSLAAYIVGILMLIVVGYNLNFGATGKHLSNVALTKVYLHELERNPDNPNLYSILGDLYLKNEHFGSARTAYRNALRLAPDNTRVLNNLAWLFATCPRLSFRNPREALALAQKAARLKPEAHILDTLAESFFVNGRYVEAVTAEKMALQVTTKNRSYYESQLKKFKTAAQIGADQ